MWLNYCVFLLMISYITMFPHFHQTDYMILSERAIINNYSSQYLFVKTDNFKFNRTHTGLNITFEFYRDFENSLVCSVQAYRFASNEYRLFPITFTNNVCHTLRNNDFGIRNIYNCGVKPYCPLRKGNYTVCNWGPDYTRFPPHFPEGKYRIDFLFEEKEMFFMSWYAEFKHIWHWKV